MAMTDCMTSYAKEVALCMEFQNYLPDWEPQTTVGSIIAYSWPVTQFVLGLHTADPGEAGDITTSAATYTGYAVASANRGVGYWGVTGSGGMNPQMTSLASITWPTAGSGPQTITAVSCAMVFSATNYSMMRDATLTSGSVVVANGDRPLCPSGSIFFKRR